ncbi:YhjD/YihY/BrkB family envelope integrity protein [Venenivibrio stagnispumantis]|nr:YhjD/YihY/BrkB family envelope integrity protein [Venenivibrio stagnispumantis]MCW4574009.1 YihY/virulence factor BrkB family protein [Venenivibrio stagnispumantis]
MGYHSASVSFYFLMSLIPLLFFIIHTTSLIAYNHIKQVIEYLYILFPEQVYNFVNLIVDISMKNKSFGVISLILSIYFSKDFFFSLQDAINFTFEDRKIEAKKKRLVVILSLPFLTFLIILFILIQLIFMFIINFFKDFSIFSFIAEYITLIQKISLIFEFIAVFFLMFSIYYFLLPFNNLSKYQIGLVSSFITILIQIIKYIFNLYLSYVSHINSVYVAAGGIFAFLIWIKLNFDVILIGSRILFYIDNQNLPSSK